MMTNTEKRELIQKLDSWFKTWWILLAVGLLLSIILIGFVVLMVAYIFVLFILYNLWRLLPEDTRATTPGKAIGFLFIPFFNFYWIFIAYGKLAEGLNAEIDKRGIKTNQINQGQVVAMCVCMVASMIPGIGLLASLAGLVVLIFVLKELKEAGKAILRHDLGDASPSEPLELEESSDSDITSETEPLTKFSVRKRNQQVLSDLTFEELKQMARAGELEPNDEIREDGRSIWRLASTIEELNF